MLSTALRYPLCLFYRRAAPGPDAVRLWGRCPDLVSLAGDPTLDAIAVVGPAADGTELHWRMTTPVLEPGKRYPVFFQHYGGPTAQTVTRGWGGALDAQADQIIQAEITGLNELIAKCKAPVQKIEWWEDQMRRSMRYRVYCHGDTDVAEIHSDVFEDGAIVGFGEAFAAAPALLNA